MSQRGFVLFVNSSKAGNFLNMGNWRLKFCEEVIRLGRRSSYFNGDALASKDSTIEDAKKDLKMFRRRRILERRRRTKMV